jgi:UPF0716 protein FxsA
MPVLEIMVLFRVHDHVGSMNTVALVIITGFVGAAMARQQGFMIVRQIQRDLAEGKMPAPRMIDGVMIIVAGVLLITPGLITDAVGFALLIPPIRHEIRTWVRRQIEKKLSEGTISIKKM